jgi:nucleotide-binding universal stress UspA family protein
VKNILVAIDDFEATTITSPLIEKTIELANAFSSKVWMLHVVPQAGLSPYNVDKKIFRREVAHELHDEHEYLQQIANCLRKRNIESTSLLVEGPIINTILHESDRLNVDLIILGCHKHSKLFGALMNDPDEGLLSKCTYPIMFVPTAQ